MKHIAIRAASLLACAVFAAMNAVPGTAEAQTCRAASGPLTRPLIELYTSEGCSSCPPADRWLATRFASSGDDEGPVALAFHVDYWDRLGWVDRFASPRYTERQYAAMRANKETFVYTPQVLLQGRDFPAWREASASAIDAAAHRPARATIELDVTPGAKSVVVRAAARIAEQALRGDAGLVVAYADNGLHSDVRAGENSGVRLAHERVVRSLHRSGAPDAHGRIETTVDIARPGEPGTMPMLVAFVQRTSNGDVLQTVVLSLDACRSG